MRWIWLGGIVLGLLIAAMSTRPAPVAAAPWCAHLDEVGTNCGFYSFRQCNEYLSGLGGYCNRNPFEDGYGYEPGYRTQSRYAYDDRWEPRRVEYRRRDTYWRTVRWHEGWRIQRHSRTGEIRAVATGARGQRVAYRLQGGAWVPYGG